MRSIRSMIVRLKKTETVLTDMYLIEIEGGIKLMVKFETTIYDKGEKEEVATIEDDNATWDEISLPPIVLDLIKKHLAVGTMQAKNWVSNRDQCPTLSASTSKKEEFRVLAVA